MYLKREWFQDGRWLLVKRRGAGERIGESRREAKSVLEKTIETRGLTLKSLKEVIGEEEGAWNKDESEKKAEK